MDEIPRWRAGPLATHMFKSLMRRLAEAGFKKEFVRSALLPDWWDDSCTEDPRLLPDIEIHVARFLGLPLAAIRDPRLPLASTVLPGTQLRRVRDLDRDRLAPAIHSAMQIAGAVVRNLRGQAPPPEVPPADGVAWLDAIPRDTVSLTLDQILGDLWRRGIPVVPLDVLPTPSFQGAACISDGRPTIVLGHKYDEPGRVAFLVAHEAGHIAAGDCTPDQPIFDEQDEVLDDDELERRADRYATRVLVGADSAPPLCGDNFKELARSAARIESESGADASTIIFAWASRTGDYAKASMAVKALYRGTGARRLLRQHFDRNIDLDAANESDRALLRCVYGGSECDAAAG